MSAVVLGVSSSIPALDTSENWDDDFEFHTDANHHDDQQRKQSQRKSARRSDGDECRKMSIASSTVLEDWDAESTTSPVSATAFSPISLASTSASEAILNQHVEQQSENWDDDFEDPRNSPKKPSATESQRTAENWDDEYDTTEDEGGDFGTVEKEEDKTVTAKSRRAALQRLSGEPHPAPPVPPPPLPTTFVAQSSSSNAPYLHFAPPPDRPFPHRSPTSSVFSVPHTVQTHNPDSSSYFGSTTHLRPSSAFALFPPSPPIHKERERRRLRKKSRPKPDGTFELASMGGSSRNASETRLGGLSSWTRHRRSFSEDADQEASSEATSHRRIRTDTPSDLSSTDDYQQRRARTVSPPNIPVPQTPTKAGALLSRIGSVKKWGVRRKRASTTPSEVIGDEPDIDLHRTPRAQSSRTSLHTSKPRTSISSPNRVANGTNPIPESSSSSSHWFFRASTVGKPHIGVGSGSVGSKDGEKSGDGAHEDGNRGTWGDRRSGGVSRNERSQSRGPVVNGVDGPPALPATPTKLVKRKSLGLVQLRRAVGLKDGSSDADSVPSSPRKTKYVGLGMGRATPTEQESERPRRKSLSNTLSDTQVLPNASFDNVADLEGDRDGSRGLLGSVRRISLVGKHKRTKSGSGVLLGSGGDATQPAMPSARASILRPKQKPPNLPYMLPPLPATSSSLSLRLPSSSHSSARQGSRHGSMQDLPTLFTAPPSAMRAASAASTQSQISQSSSILPASTVSASSSRSASGMSDNGSSSQTPMRTRRRGSTRSRISEEAEPRSPGSKGIIRRRLSGSTRRKSIDTDANPDFATRLSLSAKPSDGVDSSIDPNSSPATLLPPIELQPPSPPRTLTRGDTPATSFNSFSTQQPSPKTLPLDSTSAFQPVPPNLPLSPKKLSPARSPISQQAASLGRSTAGATRDSSPVPGVPGDSTRPPRRNSLGDLKIPARISQVQVNLRRDLGMVREFATNIEQLKDIQQAYNNLIVEVQATLNVRAAEYALQQQTTAPSPTPEPSIPRPTSPGFFSNLLPRSRSRSNTTTTPPITTQPQEPNANAVGAHVAYREMTSAFDSINSKYRVTWECADLLIELGSGGPLAADDSFNDPPSRKFPQPKNRERAITLSGDDPRPSPLATSQSLPADAMIDSANEVPSVVGSSARPTSVWRESTGRHDLSQRQLHLLREMLNNSNAHASVNADALDTSFEDATGSTEDGEPPLSVLAQSDKAWRWGDARNSTITLPSEEAGMERERLTEKERKRRSTRGKLLGMTGLRDMLRALKRNAMAEEVTHMTPILSSPSMPMMHPAGVRSTDSFHQGEFVGRKKSQPSQRRRRAKTSSGPSDLDPGHSDASIDPSILPSPSFKAPKLSPRRPSLASIFRLGPKHKPVMDEPWSPPPASSSSSHTPTNGAETRLEDESGSSSVENHDDVEPGMGDEDWDRLDSASDLDAAAKALSSATVKGSHGKRTLVKERRGPYGNVPASVSSSDASSLPRQSLVSKRSFSASQSSIRIGEPTTSTSSNPSTTTFSRPPRLSNVEEYQDNSALPFRGRNRPVSSRSVSGSHSRASGPFRPPLWSPEARSLPATPFAPTLAMTPENIKPLLENSKEVYSRLCDCIAELEALLRRTAVT